MYVFYMYFMQVYQYSIEFEIEQLSLLAMPLLAVNLVSDCRQTSHETRVDSRLDSQHVRVSVTVSCGRDNLSMALDVVFCLKLVGRVRNDLVNRVGRLGFAFQSDMEDFSISCDLGDWSLALGGENPECIVDSFNRNDWFSGDVSEDDKVLSIALCLEVRGSGRSSDNWYGLASLRKELFLHSQSHARRLKLVKHRRFRLLVESARGGVDL